MADLRSQLGRWRERRLGVLGAGNVERGDDGFGVRLVEALRAARAPLRTWDGGTCPERFVGLAVAAGAEELILADAVELGAPPGTLLLAGTDELKTRPLRTSTHRVPLAVLAKYAEGLGARAWILGVEPSSLLGPALSAPVRGTLEAVVELLRGAPGRFVHPSGRAAPEVEVGP